MCALTLNELRQFSGQMAFSGSLPAEYSTGYGVASGHIATPAVADVVMDVVTRSQRIRNGHQAVAPESCDAIQTLVVAAR